MTSIVYEPHDQALWKRVKRDLGGYLSGLLSQGALKGSTQEDAFFIKCDGEINTPEVRDRGMLIAHVGVAPSTPGEFVVVHLAFTDRGVRAE